MGLRPAAGVLIAVQVTDWPPAQRRVGPRGSGTQEEEAGAVREGGSEERRAAGRTAGAVGAAAAAAVAAGGGGIGLLRWLAAFRGGRRRGVRAAPRRCRRRGRGRRCGRRLRSEGRRTAERGAARCGGQREPRPGQLRRSLECLPLCRSRCEERRPVVGRQAGADDFHRGGSAEQAGRRCGLCHARCSSLAPPRPERGRPPAAASAGSAAGRHCCAGARRRQCRRRSSLRQRREHKLSLGQNPRRHRVLQLLRGHPPGAVRWGVE